MRRARSSTGRASRSARASSRDSCSSPPRARCSIASSAATCRSILGTLTSNGRVFLVNPHGIVFGAGATIDTAGFIASTLNIADKRFPRRAGSSSKAAATACCATKARSARAATSCWSARRSRTRASIVSEHGSVLLAAGSRVTITSPDAQGVRFELQAPSDSALNVGSDRGGELGGAVRRHAASLGRHPRERGQRRARRAASRSSRRRRSIVDTGAIVAASGLSGGAVDIQSGDLAMVSGQVDATGTRRARRHVQILGNRVGLEAGARIDASGETGGGTILVGGDYQGKNADVQNAWRTHVAPDATLRADALHVGDGGKVIVWADDITRFYGEISARGGATVGRRRFRRDVRQGVSRRRRWTRRHARAGRPQRNAGCSIRTTSRLRSADRPRRRTSINSPMPRAAISPSVRPCSRLPRPMSSCRRTTTSRSPMHYRWSRPTSRSRRRRAAPYA